MPDWKLFHIWTLCWTCSSLTLPIGKLDGCICCARQFLTGKMWSNWDKVLLPIQHLPSCIIVLGRRWLLLYYLWHSSRGDVNYTASSSCRNFSPRRPQWSCPQARPEEWPKQKKYTAVELLKNLGNLIPLFFGVAHWPKCVYCFLTFATVAGGRRQDIRSLLPCVLTALLDKSD